MVDVLVVGQVARDLVLAVSGTPEANSAIRVRSRREMLGGKGTNQAVALAQLGASAGLLGVVGTDQVADELLEQAQADGVDVSGLIRRVGRVTGLIVDLVDSQGRFRYQESLPESMLLTEEDVHASAEQLHEASCTILQQHQPPAATLAAALHAKEADRMVVLDGLPRQDAREPELLWQTDVLRADTHEATLLAGEEINSVEQAVRFGKTLLRTHRLTLLALAVGELGNVFVWNGGSEHVPLLDKRVLDTTAACDAFTAALTWSVLRGRDATTVARLATAAAAAAVDQPGVRPSLTPRRLAEQVIHLGRTTG
jgi:ribokinase